MDDLKELEQQQHAELPPTEQDILVVSMMPKKEDWNVPELFQDAAKIAGANAQCVRGQEEAIDFFRQCGGKGKLNKVLVVGSQDEVDRRQNRSARDFAEKIHNNQIVDSGGQHVPIKEGVFVILTYPGPKDKIVDLMSDPKLPGVAGLSMPEDWSGIANALGETVVVKPKE